MSNKKIIALIFVFCVILLFVALKLITANQFKSTLSSQQIYFESNIPDFKVSLKNEIDLKNALENSGLWEKDRVNNSINPGTKITANNLFINVSLKTVHPFYIQNDKDGHMIIEVESFTDTSNNLHINIGIGNYLLNNPKNDTATWIDAAFWSAVRFSIKDPTIIEEVAYGSTKGIKLSTFKITPINK